MWLVKRRSLTIAAAVIVIPAMAAWYSVQAPSAPVGYFTSAAGRDRFGSAYAEAMPEPRLVLLGLSIGGWTTMNLAVRRPAKVAGAILLDPVFTFTGISTGAVIRTIPLAVRWAPRQWRDSFNNWTANGAPVDDVPVADMIESGMRDYVRRLPAPERFSTEQLGRVRIPVLVIVAGASVMHDPAEAARVASGSLPRATVLTYEGASHAVNGEAPDRIATDAGRFLSTIG